MPPKLKFVEGEKVLCYHGPLIYEAKCLKSTVTKDKQVKYFVHYAGWSKSWDEWVPESRVLKYNEANVARQKEVQKNAPVKGKKTKAKAKTDVNTSKVTDSRAGTPVLEAVADKKTPKAKQPTIPSSSTEPEVQKKKRIKVESIAEPEEEFVSKIEVNIKIPEDLKQILVEDWDLVNRQKKLWLLPAALTVEEILDNFVNHMKSSHKTASESSIREIANGFKEYFNTILVTQLLYKLERPQYSEFVEEEEVQPSQVYGGVHLLRLFVKLGANLSYTLLDDHNIQFLVNRIQDFFKYLSKNNSSVFNIVDSVTPSQEYYKKAA
ncbi:mortality factor 4-like protein 1 [Atheta coriaria]|uniref:mortality factor 4-like protein 1 n=1 Tax=Dalotia coriaria TaxID=877792 RepID=UPI0031F448BE